MSITRTAEWQRISDKYFWLTAFIIAKNNVIREYQNSYLGIAWTVILPLIQVIIFSIIMPLIMARQVENYTFYMVTSFPLWTFFSAALVQASSAILMQGETIKRCMVSAVVFPIADVMKHFYNYLVSFFTMYAFCLLLSVKFDPIVFLMPLLLVPVFVFVMATSIGIAYIAPYIRDVGYLMHMTMNIMFWFTPVVYTLQNVSEQYHKFYWLNPFFVMMHPVQQLIYSHQLPGAVDIFAMLGMTAFSMVFCFIAYRMCRRNYVYYL